MGTDLKISLKALREVAPKLNQATDEASAVMRETERVLQELNLGIHADVVVSSQNKSAKVTEFCSLAFKRADGKFRIMVVEERSTDFADEFGCAQTAWKTVSETPWLECSRDVKLETFSKLPQLLERLIEVANESLSSCEKTQPAVRAVLDSLK